MNRNSLNLAMVLGLLVAMDYRFTGNATHEIAGVFVVLLFFIHNVLNKRWYGAIGKDKMNLFRVLSTVMNLLLFIMILLVAVTGVLISQTNFSAISLSGNLWVHELHTFSAYLGFILCGIHLGFHWNAICRILCRWLGIDASNPRVILLGRIASLFFIGYGIHASFSRQIGSRLLFQHVFGGWGATPSLAGFIGDHLAVFGCYVVITHYLTHILIKPIHSSQKKITLDDESLSQEASRTRGL